MKHVIRSRLSPVYLLDVIFSTDSLVEAAGSRESTCTLLPINIKKY